MSKTILFVYGTLKRGLKSHHLLADQEFLGEVHTIPIYRIYHISWHPGLVHDEEHGLEVKGELWAVDDECLAKLDEFEGIPDLFVREDIAIAHHFETIQAYFYNKPIAAGTVSGEEWPFNS
jgi:gamma-glutamylaminecyclotransferase